MWIEFRSSSFARIDVDESVKCRTEYRILKYEHVKNGRVSGTLSNLRLTETLTFQKSKNSPI